MKRYYNKTTGKWYIEGQSMTRSVNGGLFSGVPTTEQLAEWGFTEWIEPTPLEPTEEELLEKAKEEKINEIDIRDNSSEINNFKVNEVLNAWFTPQERSNFRNSVDAAKLLNINTVSVFIGNLLIEIPTLQAEQMLAAIQLYADQCYIVTKQHKLRVSNLETIQEVEDYDYTTGYPEMLNFTVGQ